MVADGRGPALIPILTCFAGDETWLVAAGVFDDGITLWCHRPQFRSPRLASPDLRLWLRDDVGTRYVQTTGLAGVHGPEQEHCRVDFAPRPPATVGTITLDGRFDTGHRVTADFSVDHSGRAAPDELVASFGEGSNHPVHVAPCRLVIDPDGAHPVHIFGIEVWSQQTVIWAAWNSEKGIRYVLSAGGCRWPLGRQFGNTPRPVSAARIELPFALDPDTNDLEVKVRLRGTPGHEAEGRIHFDRPFPG